MCMEGERRCLCSNISVYEAQKRFLNCSNSTARSKNPLF
uniref:Uncharacterized protein n=1 Tax=Arundo donax TaxID=35708 RepID=A0A0A9F6S8_ARUDO